MKGVLTQINQGDIVQISNFQLKLPTLKNALKLLAYGEIKPFLKYWTHWKALTQPILRSKSCAICSFYHCRILSCQSDLPIAFRQCSIAQPDSKYCTRCCISKLWEEYADIWLHEPVFFVAALLYETFPIDFPQPDAVLFTFYVKPISAASKVFY